MGFTYIVASFCQPCRINAEVQVKEETPEVMSVRLGLPGQRYCLFFTYVGVVVEMQVVRELELELGLPVEDETEPVSQYLLMMVRGSRDLGVGSAV